MKRLPDSEFEIMKAIWQLEPPVTCNQIMKLLDQEKQWKAPSVISFLLRLVEKGFLRTEKAGKERSFYPLVEKDEYLQYETKDFINRYHGNSLKSLMSALTGDQTLDDEDLNELLEWAKKKR